MHLNYLSANVDFGSQTNNRDSAVSILRQLDGVMNVPRITCCHSRENNHDLQCVHGLLYCLKGYLEDR